MRLPFPLSLPYRVPLYLAPMAGVSESPFRRLCRRFGADVVVTEFLSAEGIRRENRATIAKLRFGNDERPIGVQIFGAEPTAMGEAAALVTDVFAPEFVDINFGCPVKKVVRRNGGSGCLKDLGLVEAVIRAVARATALPVTVKIRSGWSEEMRDPVTIALRCRAAEAYENDPRGAAIEFRKHLGWYVKGLPNSAELRRKLHAVVSLGEVEGIFGDYLEAVRRGDVLVEGARGEDVQGPATGAS